MEKINRFGDTRTIWVFGVLAVVILVIVLTGVWQKFSLFIFIAELLPGFNNSAPDGTSIVGVNMETGGLEYFTGDKWREIDSKTDKFVLGSYEVDPSILNNNISSFYLDSERRPKEFSLEINSWRYWDVRQNKLSFADGIRVYPNVKNSFVEAEKIISYPEFINVGYDNKTTYVSIDVFGIVKGYYPRFAEDEVKQYPEMVAQVIAWRDSILQDHECEKFLTLNIKKDKKDETGKYAVRKVDNYIFVDLGKPVYDGKRQGWDDEYCFGVENYEDKPLDLSTKVPIEFSYTSQGQNPYYDEKVFWPQSDGSPYWTYNSWSHETPQRFDSSSRYGKFYPVFINLVRPDGDLAYKEAIFDYSKKGQGVFIAGSDKFLDKDIINGKEWQDLDRDEIDKFAYLILTEYYKHFTLKDSINA